MILISVEYGTLQTIEKALDKVDNIEKLERYLYALGHRHVHYLPVWLDPEYWDVFKVRARVSFLFSELPNLGCCSDRSE